VISSHFLSFRAPHFFVVRWAYVIDQRLYRRAEKLLDEPYRMTARL